MAVNICVWPESTENCRATSFGSPKGKREVLTRMKCRKNVTVDGSIRSDKKLFSERIRATFQSLCQQVASAKTLSAVDNCISHH
jgi:hypothetical protein